MIGPEQATHVLRPHLGHPLKLRTEKGTRGVAVARSPGLLAYRTWAVEWVSAVRLT